MKTRKFYPIFAGILHLISAIFLLFEIIDGILREPIYNLFTSQYFLLIVSFIFSLFLTYVLFSQKRNALLPFAIIIQLIYFRFPFYYSYYSVFYLSPLCSLFIIYTFILSLIFKKHKPKKQPFRLIIIWFIFYAFFNIFAFYDSMSVSIFLILFLFFYTLSWIFILLWILFPCKKVKTEKTATYENKNQQFSQSSFSNNNQPQQVKQYYSGQQYNEFNQYNNRNQQSNTLESNSSISQCKKNNEVQENKTQHKPLKQCPVCFSTVSDNALFCEICGSKLK